VEKTGGTRCARRSRRQHSSDAIGRFEPRASPSIVLLDRAPTAGTQLWRSIRQTPLVIAAAAVFPTARQTIATEEVTPPPRSASAEKFLFP